MTLQALLQLSFLQPASQTGKQRDNEHNGHPEGFPNRHARPHIA